MICRQAIIRERPKNFITLLLCLFGEKTFSPASPKSGLAFLFLLGRTQVRLRPLLNSTRCAAILSKPA